jgi:hypothetical protein
MLRQVIAVAVPGSCLLAVPALAQITPAGDAEPARPEGEERAAVPPAVPAPRPASGVQLGARLGYSLPVGPFGTQADRLGSDISDQLTAVVPLAIDAGYLVRPWLYLGGSIAWAPGIAPNTPGPCQTSDVRCFRQDVQVLLDARVYMAPDARVTGWVSIDAGWELATFATTVGSSTVTATYSGPVLFDARLGFEVRSQTIAVAPYLGVAVGEFLTHGLDPSSPPVPTWIGTVAHEWITLGLRGTYGPW